MLILFVMLVAHVYAFDNVTTSDQLMMYKKRSMGHVDLLTTSAGAPVDFYSGTETINSNLLRNEFFLDFMTHLSRERIPERLVHGRGGGAYGYFEVTHDITPIINAKLFQGIGKKTPVFTRFSPTITSAGGADTNRESRGFAVKFYTEDGIWDFVGLNVEMFTLKDPLFFPSFVHAFKPNPKTFIRFDWNMIWDFLTLRPETLHFSMRLFGDRGISDGYRYMPGFAIHTFEVTNAHGEKSYVKFHFLPDGGIRNLTSEEGLKLSGEDPDYANRDLYNAIENGNYPTWTLNIQAVTLDGVKAAKFDLFDITKVWPLKEYPLIPIGRLVLTRNPQNYFADVEQVAFNAANVVPGIIGGVDKIFEARALSYRDTQYYRLGANFFKIKINCPLHVNTYNRDGRGPVSDNEEDTPNYYPNSYNGPLPYFDKKKSDILQVYTDPNVNNFDQVADLYNSMTRGERRRLVQNIVATLSLTDHFLQKKAVKLYHLIHQNLGERIANGLRADSRGHK